MIGSAYRHPHPSYLTYSQQFRALHCTTLFAEREVCVKGSSRVDAEIGQRPAPTIGST